jgi:hypothetical protein
VKLDDIQKEWDVDSKIDRHALGDESIKIGTLHAKYYKIYIHEQLVLLKKKAEFDELRMMMYEFYTEGPNETHPKDWVFPSRGKVLKNEVQQVIDTNKLVIEETLKLGLQKEKVNFLKSIIDSFVGRGYNISAAINYERFRAGG